MLIGRAAEKRRLKAAVADTTNGLVLVQGPSGVGKTALIDAALAELCAAGAICGRGKYAQGRASSAFAPIVQALSQAASNALDLLYDPAAGAASLQTVMGAQKAQLAAAGFEVLDGIAAVTPSAAASSESAIQLVDAIARIMRWLDGFGVPVILFIDDWQRAPAEAQSFAALAAREHGQQFCTVILAERTGEERAAHAVRTKSDTIVVGPLSHEERAALLDSASGDSGAGMTIAEWLGPSASGLPLDLLEAARALRERDALTFQDGRWTIDAMRAAAIDRADFSETIVRRARALPTEVLELGVALALWGDRAPIQAIADALGQTFGAVADRAYPLAQAGLVRIVDGVAVFVHDRLRAAVLAAVETPARIALAGTMAERLAALHDPAPSIERTMLQLRLTASLDTAQPAVWRDRFALGAVAARAIADAAAAADFAEAAWSLQQREAAPDRGMNRLIYREALFAAAMRHDLTQLQERANVLVNYAGTPQQISEAYEAAILVARLVGDFDRAWAWSVEGMRRFGLRLPAKAGLHHIVASTARWQTGFLLDRLRRKALHAAEFDPLSRLCNIAGMVAFEREPLQAMLIALRAASRARRHGLRAPIWLATDAFICASFRDYRRAASLGAEALALRTDVLQAIVLYRALYFGLIWKQPLASLRKQCLSIYNIAMAEGDLATAALAIRNDSLLAWRSEDTLVGLIQSLGENEEKGERLGDARALRAIRKFTTFARALQKPSGLSDLSQEAEADNTPEAAAEWSEDMPLVRIEVLALRGNWEALAEMGEAMLGIRRSLNSHPGAVVWRFYESIARLRLGLEMRRGDMRLLRRVAALNPADHRAKVLLLDAELLRRRGKREDALRGYAMAVETSADLATRFEAGIIAECAAFGARVLGDDAAAARHEAAAQTVWQAWGAHSKLQHAPDIAPSHMLDARIAQAESQAAAALRADRAKSRFLAEVGHELRTPLQAMQGLLDIAADEKQKVDIAELRDVFGSLRSVVDDLTDMGALGANAPLRLAPVDLGQMVGSEATLFGALARRKGLSFREEIVCAPDCLVSIDGPRVRQIVRNLLSNAVKYVDRGDIVLKLHAQSIGENTMAVTLAVEDTGPGLREADLAKLFEPFERGARNDPEGLGLGLALSRSIAQRMGGKLSADNREGGGARFALTFTAERARIATPAPAAAQPARILLVEDVALNRRLLATLLGSAGHIVQEAADGGEALACWDAGRFDLVILDLGLPDMSGLALLERMRAGAASGTPVIVLTASAGEATDVRARAAGATMVLHKPIAAAELRDAVAASLQGSAMSGVESDDLARAMAVLAQEAQGEIRVLSRDLLADALDGEDAAVAAKAHRLVGLAGQFGEAQLAEAAHMLERAARNGSDRSTAVQAIEAAMTTLAS